MVDRSVAFSMVCLVFVVVGPVGCDRGGGQPSSLAGQLLGGHVVEAAGLKFEVPVTWTPVPPRSSMRAAQVVIPGAGGDAEFAVFYFGAGRGGTVENNLARWAAQVEMAPGREPSRDYFEHGGLAVTMITAQGTIKASGLGMGPHDAQPDSLLIGAVIEGPGGPWFFKATGPLKTLDPQREAFVAMLKSARPDAPS